MDFPNDAAARAVKDEYLFGKAFLVAPVYKNLARSRPVYLPAGADWYDFHTGTKQAGGVKLDAAAPLARMPLYVRAGSIVPVGPDVQYTADKPGAPLTLLVFTGTDGSFDYYEDDGVSYGYERGEFARIPLRYDAAKGTLTIGARSGSYRGMPGKRTFKVRWIKVGARAPAELDAAADATIEYSGAELTVGP
jgi:alpha-D-xyloside xylohydrolase